jgi:hypothetical protein
MTREITAAVRERTTAAAVYRGADSRATEAAVPPAGGPTTPEDATVSIFITNV